MNNTLFIKTEQQLRKVYKHVEVEYKDGSANLFDLYKKGDTLNNPRWVTMRKGIKDNLFSKGLCTVKGIK